MGSALLVAPVQGAVVLEKTVVHSFQGDGSLLETTRLRVRLEAEEDLADWSPYPIYLDDNRRLERVESFAIRPDGKRIEVKKKSHDTAEVAGGGVLHGSQVFRLIEFPPLEAGSVLELDYAVRVAPYFPEGRLVLISQDPTAKLEVQVLDPPPGWRWKIGGARDRFKIEERPSGLRIVAEGLEGWKTPPDFAPDGDNLWPVLRYGWDETESWSEVGRWYEKLLQGLPRAAPEVRRRAREISSGLEDSRERLEALLAFARGQIRYVAVEVGIGGYRPTPPPEVLERRWGDCKDKSLLLVDLLREAGIEAYPALILSGAGDRIDPDFPSLSQFNHMIVAVPAGQVAGKEDDPVGEDLLFVDPTQDLGGTRWLHPGIQDQQALVIRGRESQLVRTPVQAVFDRRELRVQVEVDADGDGRGVARLDLAGRFARTLVHELEDATPERVEELALAVLGSLLPGARFGDLRWGVEEDEEVPAAALAARVELPGLVQGTPERASLQLRGLATTPPPAIAAEREVPVVMRTGKTLFAWTLRLAEPWCAPPAAETRVENEIGSFRQTVSTENDLVRIERVAILNRRWVETGQFDDLRAVALAEHRAQKRRIRLACGEKRPGG